MPGVVSAEVNLSGETVRITYDPVTATVEQMAEAVEKAGYSLVLPSDGDDSKTEESGKRHEEYLHQLRTFTVGVIFSLPILILSMGRDFGWVLPGLSGWKLNLLLLLLATPVQFYTGFDYYTKSWKSLKNGSATMDVLVTLGSSTAFLFR